MTFPSLPDWVPWWLPILVLIPAGLWGLAMLVLPFSVIGLKSRLEAIETRLDEVQEEIRSLVLRLPELPAERLSYREPAYGVPAATIDQTYVQPEATRPPIPPAPRAAGDFIPRRPADPPPAPADRGEGLRADRPAPSPRAEPRLDWRR